MPTTEPRTVGSPLDHMLPSGPTTVMAAKVVCNCSLKVALTRSGPVVRTALSAGSADTRQAWADAMCALKIAVITMAASSRLPHAIAARRLMLFGGSAQGPHPERLLPEPPHPKG